MAPDQALYKRIAEKLRSEIHGGEYQPGDQLPTELDLSIQYSTTKVTVRRALDLLRREGLIETFHGSGSFVRDRRPLLIVVNTQYADARKRRLGSFRTAALAQGFSYQIPTPVPMIMSAHSLGPEIANRLEIEPTDEVVYRPRVVWLDGERVEIVDSYIPGHIAQDTPLTHAEAIPDGTTALLARIRELAPADDVIYARLSTEDEGFRLGLPEPLPVLVVERTTRDTRGEVVEWRFKVDVGDRIRYEYRGVPLTKAGSRA